MNQRLDRLKKELCFEKDVKVANIEEITKKVYFLIRQDKCAKNVRTKRYFRPVLAAAVLLCAAGISAVAASFGWHEKLLEYFHYPTEEQLKMVENAVDTPMATGSDNGYTVNVLNTLADRHGIYVLYELLLPAGKELDPQETQEYVKDMTRGISISFGTIDENNMLVGVGRREILNTEKNKITMFEYMGTGGNLYENQPITLTVAHNRFVSMTDSSSDEMIGGTYAQKAEKGDFAISVRWDFAYRDTGKSFVVDKKLDLNGSNDNILKTVDVSPISVWITAEGDDIQNATVDIQFKDGTRCSYSNKTDRNAFGMFANNLTGNTRQGITNIGYVFNEIMDVDTIYSITIGDQTVMLQ